MAGAQKADTDAGGSGGNGGEGVRAVTQMVDAAEERVEHLERVVSKEAEAHLRGPAPTTEGEEATVFYFAFGSNINKKVFEGRRRIRPAESVPAVLPHWVLKFSQPGLPYSEPAFAAVEPAPAPSTTSTSAASCGLPDVHGVVHRITPSQWAYVLETEGGSGSGQDSDRDHAYRVVEAEAEAYDGRKLRVVTLTISPRIKARLQGRDALPSLRYLTLIREGAEEYGLSPEYRAWLQELQPYRAEAFGQRVGAWVFSSVAGLTILPVWAGLAFLRRLTGMHKASNDRISRFVGSYTAACFTLIHGLHELLRPVLGCGTTCSAPAKRQQ